MWTSLRKYSTRNNGAKTSEPEVSSNRKEVDLDSITKAVATEAWSQLVHSIVSWCPPSDMSMLYYFTLADEDSKLLEIYKYELGSEIIQARMRFDMHSQVMQLNQQEYRQGIEYIRDCKRSDPRYMHYDVMQRNGHSDQQGIEHIEERKRSNPHYDHVMQTNEHSDQQGIEHIKECKRSNPHYDHVMQTNEHLDQQGIEHIVELKRSNPHYDVVLATIHESEQGISNIRDCIRSTLLLKPGEYEDHQSSKYITETMRSRELSESQPKLNVKLEYQEWINCMQAKEILSLFDELLELIKSHNTGGEEEPTMRFQVLEVIKLVHHYGVDTIQSGAEEQLKDVNQKYEDIDKDSSIMYKKKYVEVMLNICEIETCQRTIRELIGKAERNQVFYKW